MEFNFNTFFGLEEIINNKREIIVFWSFLGVLTLTILLSFISYIFRKLKISQFFIESLLWSLLFTFITGTITILLLFFISDISGVKLVYIWLSIFLGYFCFSVMHNNALKKLYIDYSKTIIKNKI